MRISSFFFFFLNEGSEKAMREIKGESRKHTWEMVPITPMISIMSANWSLLK